MTVRGIPAPQLYQPSMYWEDRAQRFAGEGAGLAAVCAYGMPEFYNRAIQLEQRLALLPWLDVKPGTRVLDVGCGVGRWSRLLAAKGAQVTGVDLSPTMIAQAQQRAAAVGLADRCQFRVQDLSSLESDGQFDVVLGVTVLQHILDPELLRQANELGPSFTTTWEIGVYIQNKLFNETLAELEKAKRERKGDPILIYDTGMIYAAQGKRAEALQIIKDLEGISGASLSQAHLIAKIYATLNEKEMALSWLERGLATGAIGVFYKDDPVWDAIRSDPRFIDLVRRTGIPL